MPALLVQASQLVSSSLNGVPKDAVFPLFESAGRLHLALTGVSALSGSHAAKTQHPVLHTSHVQLCQLPQTLGPRAILVKCLKGHSLRPAIKLRT